MLVILMMLMMIQLLLRMMLMMMIDDVGLACLQLAAVAVRYSLVNIGVN
jgi:hypothetical protein